MSGNSSREVPDVVTQADDLPAALAEPVRPVPARWIGMLCLAQLGYVTAILTPNQFLTADLVARLDPVHKVALFSVVSTIAAIGGIIAGPAAGVLSDRTAGRLGRRRPWIIGGTVVFAAGLALTAAQRSVLGVALLALLAAVGGAALCTAMTALLPDQVPVRQRGTVSGWIGVPQALGLVLGLVLTTVLLHTPGAGYLALAGLLVVCVAPLALGTPDPPLPAAARAPFSMRHYLASLVFDPRRHPDVGWTWLGRFLVWLGNALGTLYLLYFLEDQVHYRDPETGLLILTALYTVFVVLTAIVSGILSDRLRRRKMFVVGAAGCQAVAALLLAFSPQWTTALVAAVVLGIGWGVFQSVDQALMSEVLPDAASRARFLGALSVSNNIAGAVATALAGLIVSHLGGYSGLYLATALCSVAGAVAVRPIRSVR